LSVLADIFAGGKRADRSDRRHRAEPRNKPPFPVAVGLWQKPTVINNVETFINPREPLRPPLYTIPHARKNLRALINVSTLLITVGFLPKSTATGNGGLLRGSARCPSIASISALSPRKYIRQD